MSILSKLWRLGLVIAIIFLAGCSLSKPVKTIDIGELKRIRKSEGAQRVLISNNVRCISADENSVWIATDRGVSRFERAAKNWTHYTKEDGLNSDNINAVAFDQNRVWFGTDDGVSQYNVDTGTWRSFKEKDGLKGKQVFRIAVDADHVWFGTDQAINRYTRSIDSWSARTPDDGLSYNIVSAVAVEDEYVWIGTHNRVNRYSKITDSWNIYSTSDGLVDNLVTTIAVSDNHVWFGTYRSGISVYNKTNQTFRKPYTKSDVLSSDDIRSIAIDGNNTWIGTANGGVHRYIGVVDTWVGYTKDDGLASNNISWITAYKSEIWLGTYDSGVSMYDKVENRWITFVAADSPPEDDVKAIVQSSSGKLWIATSGGLLRYDPGIEEWVRYGKKDGLSTEYITDLKMDGNILWIGTARGLASYDGDSDYWQFYSKSDGLSENFITSLAVTGGETGGHGDAANPRVSESPRLIWVGTNRGLFRGSTDGQALIERFEPVVETSSFSSEKAEPPNPPSEKAEPPSPPLEKGDLGGFSDYTITSIAQEGDRIWIGTDRGLWKYDISERRLSRAKPVSKPSDGTAHRIPAHGLPDSYINFVLIQGDQVWLGTRGGIGIYEPDTGAWRSIGTSEGLPSRNVRFLMSERRLSRAKPVSKPSDTGRNSIWVGTTGGLVRYDTGAGELKIIEGSARYSITDIAHFTDDIFWLGTTSGVVEYHASSGDYREHRAIVTRHPLKEASVANIEFDGDAIWFSNWSASHNGAVIRYDRGSDTWRRFTRETILGDTKVKSPTIIKRICVDDKWVWFATDHGVLQYDKLADTWQHFTMEDGLVSDNIRCVQSGVNAVWVCPEIRTRINKYDKRDGTWSEIKLSRLIHPRNYVYDMQADGDVLWLTISSSGVRRISEDGEQRVYMRDDGLAQMGARWINVDEDYVWVAHWKGRGSGTLSRYDKKTSEWTVYSSSDVLEGDMLSRIVTGERYTWILYEAWQEGSVTGYNRKTGEWVTMKPRRGWGSRTREVCEDGGYLWLAPDWGDIKKFHMASGTWVPLPSVRVNERALRADDKYVWIGTAGYISRYDKERESRTNYTRQNTLLGESVQAVVSDDRYVWCGTSQGISRYDKVYGTWTNLSRKRGPYSGTRPLSHQEGRLRGGMINDNITALAVDDRFLWVATRGGAGRYDKITDRWDSYGVWYGLPGMDVTSVVVDGYDIWMGTNGGMGKFPRMSDDPNVWISYTSGLEMKAGTMTREYANTLVSNEVWSTAADRDCIWVGTMRGVSRYNKEADTWTTYTTEDGLSSNEISSICVDGSAVWFGSDNGVTVYDKEAGKWTIYAAKDGLASDRITCIAGSADAVWIGTFDAGLTRYDKKAGTWQTYSRKDGLAHDCVLSVSVDENSKPGAQASGPSHIWIGTRRGLSRFDIAANNWTTFTEYSDSEDELDMVTPRRAQVSNLPAARKTVNQKRIGDKVSRPAHRDVEIAEINSNPPGRDEETLNGEWVKIANTTDAPVDMTGFTLSDYAGHVYKFGERILPGGSAVTVFTGSGTDTPSSLYWGSKTPIWNNRGDTAYLRDADGELVDVYSY